MSSHDTLNPTGGVAMGHVVESPNPDENLLERMLSRENMQPNPHRSVGWRFQKQRVAPARWEFPRSWTD